MITRPTVANRISALVGLGSSSETALEPQASAISQVSRTSIVSQRSMAAPQKRGTKISFGNMNEIQEYEKESAIDTDDKLRQQSTYKRPSHLQTTEEARPSKFKSVVTHMQAAKLWAS